MCGFIRQVLVFMWCLQGVIARCPARGHAEMDDGSPALEPVVAGAVEQVRNADGCSRGRGFDPAKQRMVIRDRVRQ